MVLFPKSSRMSFFPCVQVSDTQMPQESLKPLKWPLVDVSLTVVIYDCTKSFFEFSQCNIRTCHRDTWTRVPGKYEGTYTKCPGSRQQRRASSSRRFCLWAFPFHT